MSIDLTNGLAAKFGKEIGDIFTSETALFLLETNALLRQKSEFDRLFLRCAELSSSAWMSKDSKDSCKARLLVINHKLFEELRNTRLNVDDVMNAKEQKEKYKFTDAENTSLLQINLKDPIYNAVIALQDRREDFDTDFANKMKESTKSKLLAIEFTMQEAQIKKEFEKLEKELKIRYHPIAQSQMHFGR